MEWRRKIKEGWNKLWRQEKVGRVNREGSLPALQTLSTVWFVQCLLQHKATFAHSRMFWRPGLSQTSKAMGQISHLLWDKNWICQLGLDSMGASGISLAGLWLGSGLLFLLQDVVQVSDRTSSASFIKPGAFPSSERWNSSGDHVWLFQNIWANHLLPSLFPLNSSQMSAERERENQSFSWAQASGRFSSQFLLARNAFLKEDISIKSRWKGDACPGLFDMLLGLTQNQHTEEELEADTL